MGAQLSELLSFIERKEARLLNWGVTNSAFTQDEIREIIEEFIITTNGHADAFALFGELTTKRLLFEFMIDGSPRYRTRMAETIRLLFALKQLFPWSMDGGGWRCAANLVSDYRLMLRSRSYPKRDLLPLQVFEDTELSDVQQSVADVILNAKGDNPFQLSQFQKDALERILKNCGPASPMLGTVICAGTGSGKTLAFYLPALLHLAETVDARNYTRCLAIYPRVELLKDQFAEMLAYLRKVNPVLVNHGKRPLSIAVLFGDVPSKNTWLGKWEQNGDGRICPYIVCPTCQSPSVWRNADIAENRQRLYCSGSCATEVVQEGEVLLTRNELTKKPADFLLTTTEMVNRYLTDNSQWAGSGASFNRIFGVGTYKPDLILLDEIHTYEGHSGAQIALLLRRWRQFTSSYPHYVGLSATLENAERFMADLIGVKRTQVQKVEQKYTEVEYEGMEYMLALRGDPVSSTNLLSTSIQTLMLMGRILDGPSAISQKIYGQKVFAFTDDLDVTNRLYFSYLDAEGRNSYGMPSPRLTPLANLRFPGGNDHGRRDEGQTWGVCESIEDGSLQGDGLVVGKTSSQDSGVDQQAKVIVATASLEVGYNDSDVGCVLQHKTPRGAAQFLQRKGRGGRDRQMRPWTIIALNDCGRDRVSFQNFEALFDPSLSSRTLPVSNTYVLRMQAVFALMEWVYVRLGGIDGGVPYGNIRTDFSKVSANDFGKERQAREKEILEGVLDEQYVREDLARYLEKSLQQPRTVIDELLWAQPRSLMTNVIPSLLRRLETDWRNDNSHGKLLPGFVPGTLFYDLDIPEIKLNGAEDDLNEVMPTLRAIKEFAPGRVSKRFGTQGLKHAHWVPIALTNDDQSIELNTFCKNWQDLGVVNFSDGCGQISSIRCIQPGEYCLDQMPDDLSTGSNSMVRWGSQVTVKYDGLSVELPHQEDLCKCIESITFFTHSYSEPLEMHRFALSAKANARADREDYESVVSYELDGERVAIGSGADVDGFAVSLKLPDDQSLLQSAKSCAVQLRDQRFNDFVRQSAEFDELRINIFQRDWVILVFQAALLRCMSEVENCSVVDAVGFVLGQQTAFSMEEVIASVYQGRGGGGDDQDDSPGVFSERQQELIGLFDDFNVREILKGYATALYEDIDETWLEWIKEKVKTTLGSAMFQALFVICPDIDQKDLHVDLSIHVNSEQKYASERTIWFTEDSVGGGGAIERILRSYGDDPQRFFRLVAKMLERSEIDNTGHYLNKILRSACEEGSSLQRLFNERRNATQVDAIETSTQNILSHLTRLGYPVYHSLVTTINARVLKPNSSSQMDRLLLQLTLEWDCVEQKCGFEVDGRVWAYLATISGDYDADIQCILSGHSPSDDAFNQKVIYSLLFPRGKIYRNSQLSYYNPYGNENSVERLLLKNIVQTERKTITYGDDGWSELFEQSLAEQGCAVLNCREEQFAAVKGEVMYRAVHPIEYNAFHFYPVVTAVIRSEDCVQIELTLKEFGK